VSDVDANHVDDDNDADEELDANQADADYETARAVLAHVLEAIVADPDAVRVDLDDHGRTPVLEVRVGPGDMGRVIGRRGRVANAIRTVVRAAAAADEEGDLTVEFVD
jgi:predicted RNA-binding protein YlqC (UPF0109 family)